MRIDLPGVLEVHAHIALAGVPPHQRLLRELRRFSRQEIAQRQSGVLGVELEFTRGVCTRQIIRGGVDVIDSKSNLMPAPRPTDVLGELKCCRIGQARRSSRWTLEQIEGS